MGYDTFSGEWYPVQGGLGSEPAAQAAADDYLRALERDQPTATSGGQEGIQDQVYVVGPNGICQRVIDRGP
jgi:hypothetical protein